MANAVERKRCCFRWDIYNPFLPRRDLEATFYYEYPFKVIFEPLNRSINYWEFAITFAYNARFETPPNEVVAHNVEVTIHNGVVTVKKKRLGGIKFSRGNRYCYRFQETVVTGELWVLSLRVEFELTPKEISVVNYCYDYLHLLQLSDDVKRLLDRAENTDLILWSAYNHRFFNVHSYILDFRWPNLHKVHRTINEIETNISENLLKNIVNYMYSGDFPIILPFMTVPQYGTELCRVVDRYKLDHLYKVLVKNDLKQHRATINNMYMASHLFPLRIVENRAVNNLTYTWMVRPDFRGQYEIDFKIRVGNEAGSWLSYSLQSLCESRVYVEVDLEVVKKQEETTSGGTPETTSFPFDLRYQKMYPDETVASGPVLFLGSPEIFGDSNGIEFNYSIRCCLKVSRGRRLQLLKSVDSMEYRGAKERYEILSDHMRQLLEDRRKANMILASPPSKDMETRIIHKEFFKIRVPDAWTQIHNAKEWFLPDRAICNIEPYTLPCLVEYIYTGKVQTIPAVSIDRIKLFADQTGMFYLRKLAEMYTEQKLKKLL